MRKADQRRYVSNAAMLFSDDNRQSASPVSLRAAFVSLPQYHHNTCPANLATTGDVTSSSSQPAGDEMMFDAPALAEETLLDVSLRVTYLGAIRKGCPQKFVVFTSFFSLSFFVCVWRDLPSPPCRRT